MKAGHAVISSSSWRNVRPDRGEARARKIVGYIPKEGVHLDVGAGEGCGTMVISQIKKTFGVEYSPEAVRRAQKKGLVVYQGSATSLPCKDNYFSSITCLDVLEHIPDYESAMREIARALKAGGILVLQTPIQEYLKERILRAVRNYNLIKQKQPYDKPLPRKKILSLIRKNGLKLIEEKPVQYWASNPLVHLFSWSRIFVCTK